MFDDTLTMNGEALRESLHAWQAEQDALESEWRESLDALTAYQSHLDNWQRELAQEREALELASENLARQAEEFARQQAAAATQQDASAAETTAELSSARAKVAQLSEQLLARTEELRVLDQKRAELATELEVARATGKQLAADAEEQRRALELERKSWTEQLTHLRALSEQRATAPEFDEVRSTRAPVASRESKPVGNERTSTNNPVLGSIVEQFGKLRQQRASDRQSGRNSR